MEEHTRSTSFACNHACGFTRALQSVQDKLSDELKLLCEGLCKGRKAPSSDVFQTLDDIKHLVAFNHAISGNLARAVMNILEGNLVDLATWVLVRRASYLPLVRHGVKPKTVLAIHNSPIHMNTLFAEEHLKTAEAEL